MHTECLADLKLAWYSPLSFSPNTFRNMVKLMGPEASLNVASSLSSLSLILSVAGMGGGGGGHGAGVSAALVALWLVQALWGCPPPSFSRCPQPSLP